MKLISLAQASEMLMPAGLYIGPWRQISANSGLADIDYLKVRAPRESLHLYNFSNHAASWLPKGSWVLFQIDNSTFMSNSQTALLSNICRFPEIYRFTDRTSLLFNFPDDPQKKLQPLVEIAQVIHFFLLFELHAYLVSENSSSLGLLLLQDGVVYAGPALTSTVERSLYILEGQPLVAPDWVVSMDANT